MACPVCDSTETSTINVRVSKESDVSKLVGSTWGGRNVARCDGCGVLYDHQVAANGADADESQATDRSINCPDCGSPNPSNRANCTYCDSALEPARE
ncbi:hypothetical protein L593_03090 [Salinarchaeum sp. Harcht-Bsk1]|uniref:hypothetical protein n=1 Tax=Salinarchaeum sp. Harcht-Bsk1 TaxID=1333523 RepID=UPI0003423992|nr:hypothetical protein [Salinarchaeum sp. Harcht-Bsk1]AGN00569.1 hypothetical protein L593_03090 [Salinarchaeum sp. Harcht-Bsk1]